MWLIKVFGVIAFTALCAAEDPHNASTVPNALPTTTLLPMSSVTPTLSLDSPDQIYPGERISLTCTASGSSPDWTYQWFHPDQSTPLQSPDPSSTSYTIDPAVLTHNGTYWCRIKRGEQDESAFSKPISLSVTDPPKPSLKLLTSWLDVFHSEEVELSCGIDGSSDWTFTWYRNGQELQSDSDTSLDAGGSSLTIHSATQSHQGPYTCQGHHKTRRISSRLSDPTDITVYENKPQPTLSKNPGFEQIYAGEPVSISCTVSVSSGWEYQWYKDGDLINGELITSDSSNTHYTISRATPSDGGIYTCNATRGDQTFFIENSETLTIIDPPKPSLTLQTSWLDVFHSEEVELSCGIDGSSDWTFTWYRNGQELQSDSDTSLDAGGSSLTIHSATQSHQGPYTCQGHHKTRRISSRLSDPTDITVYENKPQPTLSKDPGFEQIYAGEPVSISCTVSVSSGWEYQWYKDGELITSDSSNTNYTISRPTPSDGGIYTCNATRGDQTFFIDNSETLTIIDPPKPSLTLQTSWLDVFHSEEVELSCGIDGSSDWTFTWYRNGQELQSDSDTSLDAGGSSLTIHSATQSHQGPYTCQGHHKTRRISSRLSDPTDITVYENKPKPTLRKDPDVKQIYAGEPVSISCTVSVSSGWEYQWYKDGEKLTTSDSSNTNYTISRATPSDSGIYTCNATRGKPTFFTDNSETLTIIEIPVPSLKLKTPWLDVFPTESVALSCGIQSSSDWTYRWRRDAQELQVDRSMSLDLDGATLSINSASETHTGKYRCWGQYKSRSVTTNSSSELILRVYDKLPKPVLMQNPEYKEMYVGESLSFSCEVNISSGWKYLWNKDGKQLTMSGSNYAISSAVSTDTGAYKCRAKRGQKEFMADFSQTLNLDIQVRPWAVMTLLTGWSEVFSTDSLVLKCEVHGTQDHWNYTWFRGGEEIDMAHADKHTVTPQDDPNQSEYTCKGIRTERPTYSIQSEPFGTRNLLLKRRVLLSISGCIFFGIIAVFLGCIALRLTRKPAAAAAEDPEESNLFLTMAQLKARDDAPSPLAEYITEAALTAPTKDGDDNGTICSESTPLPITTQEDQAVTSESTDTVDNNGGLMSFKQ